MGEQAKTVAAVFFLGFIVSILFCGIMLCACEEYAIRETKEILSDPQRYATKTLSSNSWEVKKGDSYGVYFETEYVRSCQLSVPTTMGTFERTRTDINKSRMLGSWAAEKSKEAAKGFIDGFKNSFGEMNDQE